MNFFERLRARRELNEELRSHIAHRIDDLERSGLARPEAERRARIEFGAFERFREESSEQMGGVFFDTLVRDVRLAFRVLRKYPGFTFTAIVTLALAVGANAVVFGVMDGLILRPLNVPHPETLYGTEYGNAADAGWQSYPNYKDLRDRSKSFEDLAAFNFAFVGFDKDRDPVPATGYAVTGNYFDVLGVQPYLGRLFHGSDEHGPGSAPYLVLTYTYWQTHFQSDPNVIGRVVKINRHPYTIIGVAQPEFGGTLLFISASFFMPIVNQEQLDGQNSLTRRNVNTAIFEVFGHLKPGVMPEQAVTDLNVIGNSLETAYPGQFGRADAVLSHPGLTSFGAPTRQFLTGLMMLAGLILLAACANLGSLFGAHAADRGREVALRLALGSGRVRILRQLLTEALIIAIAGGAAGLLISIDLLRALSVWQPLPTVPVHVPVHADAKLYLLALALSVFSGVLFGIVPVRQVLRANPYEIVKGSNSIVGRRLALRDVLLAVQIAICAVLVTSSIVAMRGLSRSLETNFGFNPQNALLVDVNLGMAGYTHDQVPQMQKRMIAAVQSIAGVESVGLVNGYPPLVNGAAVTANVFKNETTDLRLTNVAANPFHFEVSPSYFAAAGTAILAGRDLDWHDGEDARLVAVVNRLFAERMFGSIENAVGGYFKQQDGRRVQVVGVVENGKYQGFTEVPHGAIFLPFLTSPAAQANLIVRSSRKPQDLASATRTQLRGLDSALLFSIQTWPEQMSAISFPPRMAAMTLGVLGMIGGMLSITGIFGMAAYSVGKRQKELGIRIAVGASRAQVLQAALGRVFKLLAVGSAAGLILGFLAAPVLAFIVYQATPRDPVVLGGAVLIMLALGVLASWIPARRALLTDPSLLLRNE